MSVASPARTSAIRRHTIREAPNCSDVGPPRSPRTRTRVPGRGARPEMGGDVCGKPAAHLRYPSAHHSRSSELQRRRSGSQPEGEDTRAGPRHSACARAAMSVASRCASPRSVGTPFARLQHPNCSRIGSPHSRRATARVPLSVGTPFAKLGTAAASVRIAAGGRVQRVHERQGRHRTRPPLGRVRRGSQARLARRRRGITAAAAPWPGPSAPIPVAPVRLRCRTGSVLGSRVVRHVRERHRSARCPGLPRGHVRRPRHSACARRQCLWRARSAPPRCVGAPIRCGDVVSPIRRTSCGDIVSPGSPRVGPRAGPRA